MSLNMPNVCEATDQLSTIAAPTNSITEATSKQARPHTPVSSMELVSRSERSITLQQLNTCTRLYSETKCVPSGQACVSEPASGPQCAASTADVGHMPSTCALHYTHPASPLPSSSSDDDEDHHQQQEMCSNMSACSVREAPVRPSVDHVISAPLHTSRHALNGGAYYGAGRPVMTSSGYDELDSVVVRQVPTPLPALLTTSCSQYTPAHSSVYRGAPRAVFDQVSRDVVRDTEWPPTQFRDPDLSEVIDFLANSSDVVKSNAAAYLQHLCYMSDHVKQQTRALGGVHALVTLLTHPLPEVHRNACGALRNLSYGRANDENKVAISEAGGVQALTALLRHSADTEVGELTTGILWNLSSCERLKTHIIETCLSALVARVIVPAMDRGGFYASAGARQNCQHEMFASVVLRNATGILRNVSSAGVHARACLRGSTQLLTTLVAVVHSAIETSSMDSKCVENCVCLLRNVSYRCHESSEFCADYTVPAAHSTSLTAPGRKSSGMERMMSGCFGQQHKPELRATRSHASVPEHPPTTSTTSRPSATHLLWDTHTVQMYLHLLSHSSNVYTLEAAAGTLQNLCACADWPPAIDVRAIVRRHKGLPTLVHLLHVRADRVVVSVATALRNLSIDQRNRDLIGKYATADLVSLLVAPPGVDEVTAHGGVTAAVLSTLLEVVRHSAEFCRCVFELGAVPRLRSLAQRGQVSDLTSHDFTAGSIDANRSAHTAQQLLHCMWSHAELREMYRKADYRECDFMLGTRNQHAPLCVPNGAACEVPSSRCGGAQPAHTVTYQTNGSVTSSLVYGLDNGDTPASVDVYGGGASGHVPGVEPVYARVNRKHRAGEVHAHTWNSHHMQHGDSWV